MKITRITKQQKEGRYNLYSGSTFIVGISAETLLESKLAVGDELTEPDSAQLRDRDEMSRVLAKAYDYLSRRRHSEHELRTKLGAKDYSAETITNAIQRLKDLAYLDDHAFARQWIESRGMTRGVHVLRQELRQKGVSPEIIDETLKDHTEATESLSQVRALAMKRYIRLSSEPWEIVYSRLGSFLTRRGYGAEDIRLVLSEIRKFHVKTAT